MKKILAASALLAVTLFWACHLSPSDTQDHFDLVGDSAWTDCDSVLVVLMDTSGHPIDTLFNDSLHALSQLTSLPVGKFKGGAATVLIRGSKKGGLCFEQTRTFDDAGGPVIVDTTKDPGALPIGVHADPESLVLTLGGPSVPLKGTVRPAYADQSVTWALAGDGIVSMGIPSGSGDNQIKIYPERVGKSKITLRSRKDSSLSFEIGVRVLAPSATKITLDKDSLVLYAGGPGDSLKAKVAPDGADQKVQWVSLNPAVLKVDSLGHVSPVGPGQTYAQAKSLATSDVGSALITVVRDIPILTVASKTGAAVNAPITFAPKATQQFGSIVLYKWDLNGDGNWDDSLAGNWPGTSVDLDVKTAKFAKEGPVTVKFLVRDGEGNEAQASVPLDIGNQAPEIQAIRADTVISIKDSIAMTASVRDADGKVAWFGWDYDGDGIVDDSLVTADSAVEIVMGHRYMDAGAYSAILRVRDDNGKTRRDTVKVKVELDPPKADAGSDTTVTVSSVIPFHAKGSDKFGSIAKREVKVGAGPFIALSKQDTALLAPAEPGNLEIILRVTDDDGLIGKDTVEVNVVLSANADLSNLVFSAGPLDPAFKSNISFFGAHAAFADSLVTLTPTAKDPAAHITVNATTTASGSASAPVKVQVGSNLNVFQVLVTAADGTQHVYNVSVVRDPSADATLSKLEVQGFKLRPDFSPTTVDYADTVANAVTSVTLKPILAVATASLAVNDSAMASGTATFPQPLQVGDNLFKVAVTSQSGTIKTIYQIKVVRLGQLVLLRSLSGKPATQTDSLEVPINAARGITSLPVTGYHFVKWTVLEGTGILSDSAANPASLTLKSGKVRVQAEFAVNRYTITAGSGAGGGISPSGAIAVDEGKDTAFTISAAAGNRLKSVTVDGTDATSALSGGAYLFKKVTADHSISAVFVRQDTLTTSVGAGGSVTPTKAILDRNTDTSFTITPATDFRIQSVKIDGVDSTSRVVANKYTFHSVNGNHVLAVTFIKGYSLIGVAGPGGSITPTSAGVDAGGSQTFTITPNANYRVKTLLDNGTDVLASMSGGAYTLTNINAAHTVGATFIQQFTLTVNVSGSGTGKVDPGTTTLDAGASQTFNFEAQSGSSLVAISVDGAPAPIASSYAFANVSANHTLSLVFNKFYTISTSFTGSGAITPVTTVVEAGKDTSISVVPATGYRTTSLILDGSPITPVGTLSFPAVSANHAVNATFTRVYPLTATVSLGLGTITPGASSIDSLGSQTFNFSPAANYRVWMLMDNGKTVDTARVDTKYDLTNIIAKHDMTMFFLRQYSITSTTDGRGTVTIPASPVDSNGTSSITITPNAGYRVDSVFDNGSLAATNGFSAWGAQTLNLTGLQSDHAIRAVFRRYYTLTASTASGSGSITPASVYVDSLGSQDFTITPGSGYVFSSLLDGTTPVSPTGNIYTVANVVDDHNLTANFTAVATNYALAVVSNAKLSVNVKGPTLGILIGEKSVTGDSLLVKVPSGSAVTISAAASFSTGLRTGTVYFQYWTTKAGQICDNPLTIDMTGNIEYRAIYATTPPGGIVKGCTSTF